MKPSKIRHCNQCGVEIEIDRGRNFCLVCFRERNKEAAKKARRKKKEKKFGISEEVARTEEGNCRICGDRSALVLDHCHKTETFRGFLCGKCNLGIGFLKDSPSAAASAWFYLVAHRIKTKLRGWFFQLKSQLFA